MSRASRNGLLSNGIAGSGSPIVHALAVDSVDGQAAADVPNLYAGGKFTMVGGVELDHIAKWNGANWSPLGSGVGSIGTPSVRAMTFFDDGLGGGPTLYVAGSFTTAGGVVVNGIAKWDGEAWTGLGDACPGGVMDGCGVAGTVYALEVLVTEVETAQHFTLVAILS